MNIFEQFANMKSEEAATANDVVVNEEIEEEFEEEVEDESIDLVDDGQGNLMMHIPGDPAEIIEQNKAKAEKAKEDNKKDKKKKKPSVEVKPVNKEPVKTANELIEEKLKEYPKIIVKVFGEKLYDFDNPDEIKMLKIEDITNRLIIEHDYEEFANGVVWTLTSNADKSIGYLIPTYKFQSKG